MYIHWYYFHDINNIRIKDPLWSDFVGTQTQHMYKRYTTKILDTKHKVKYSPNSTYSNWREKGRRKVREKDKLEFKKMLKNEYGLKHYYTK